MKLPEGFDFVNGGIDFLLYNENKKKTDSILSYSDDNVKRTNVFLFGEIFNKRTIYKYIDRRKFKDYVSKQVQGWSLCFQEPSIWQDPYESRFYKADYSNVFSDVDFVKNKQMSLYACCFAMKRDSEPSWKMYVDEKNQDDRKVCIQLKIDFKALLDYLNYYITTKLDNQYILIAGPVKYMEKSDVNSLHRPDEKGKLNQIFSDFNFTKYLRLLKVKREAYKYEDEIRFFLIPRNGKVNGDHLVIPIPAECPEDVAKTKRWGKIIEMLYLDPNSEDQELEDYRNYFLKTKLGLKADEFDISDIYISYSNIIIGETKEEEISRKQKEIDEQIVKYSSKLKKSMKASI